MIISNKLGLWAAIICALPLSALSKDVKNTSHWNQFRGPNGDGVSTSSNLPTEFSGTKNVRWRAAIHGLGWSSPVVWKNQVWITTAREDGSELFAVCVNLETGKIMHDIKVLDVANPQNEWSDLNTHATPTPIIEEGRIYVHFGTYGTACLDTVTGKKLWERRDLNCDHRVRPASSPIMDNDLLFLTYDGVDQQFIAAVEKETGQTRWLRKRTYKSGQEPPKSKPNDNRKSYATPTIIEHNGRRQLISPAAEATYSYDPSTGKELWFIRHGKGYGYNVTCRPIYSHGLVFTNSGISKNLFAIDPSGSGDVTDTHIRWTTRRGVSNIPAPLVVGDNLYMIGDSGGMVSCLEAKTGKQIFQERLGGIQNHWVSPIYADGKIYFFSRDGVFSVIEASSEFKILSKNESDTVFVSMPAIVGDSMLIRSNTHLYRIAEGYKVAPLPVVAAKQKSAGSGKSGKASNKDLDELGQQLKAAVASGKMTEAEAIAKWKEAVAGKGGAKGKGTKEEKGKVDLKELAQQLREAVSIGKMTQKEAFEKLSEAAAGKQPIKKDKPIKVDLDEYGQQLKKAVESGKMTEAEAIAKYKEAVEAQKGGKATGSKKETKLAGKVDLQKLGEELKEAVESGKMTKDEAIAEYIKAGDSFGEGKGEGKVAGKGGGKGGNARGGGKGRPNFYSIVIGRLKSKDIELGEFTMEVDYATLNRHTSKWIKDEIIGKTVKVSGVSGQFRDNLLLIKKDQTLKVRTAGYLAESKTLLFAHKFNVLEPALPFDPEAHGVPPKDFRGFEGGLQGKIIEVGGYEVLMEVEKVMSVGKGNKATVPNSIKGKRVRLAGFYPQYEKLFKELRPTDIIQIEARHQDAVFDMFQVQGELVKIEE
jgi:outer membrane protein assembly factor BamB